MTLRSQLNLIISVVMLVALVGIQLIHIGGARRHQQAALESLAQDTATSLGLSLGTLLRGGDTALAETVVNPVFDRGFYRSIEFVSIQGETLVSKRLESRRHGDYPEWFAELVPLGAPEAQSLVSAGWRQLGRVKVSVHPAFAYAQLWASTRDTFSYMAVIYLAALLVVRLFLAGVLRPLAAVERAAQSISRREFVTLDMRPGSREVARVVEAINAMSRRIREAFESESSRADAAQRAAYVDAVTGLDNREGVLAQFDAIYGGDHEPFVGTIATAKLVELASINAALGTERCDRLLHALADVLRETVAPLNGLAARWSGGQFVLVLPKLGAAEAIAKLGPLQPRLESVVAEQGAPERNAVSIGAAVEEGAGVELEALVAEAILSSSALGAANTGESSTVRMSVLRASEDAQKAGLSESTVREALAARRIALVGQVALALPGRALLHTEIMARLVAADGTQFAAGQFLPIVSEHGLGGEFDRAVIARALEFLRGRRDAQTLCVNLSAHALSERALADWIVSQVRATRGAAARIVFELSENAALQDEAAAIALARALEGVGSALAVDHFGIHRNSLPLVSRMRPAYLKLAAAHTRKLAGDAGTRFFIEAVVRAARQLDIDVIAQAVEDEATLPLLESLGLRGFQGFVTGAPAPLASG